ncbi:MAG: endolytic transglycosylase MltG [Paramuribaculum sp.]|nr:endolytic transglycosylase MltG [Paramuribaculum sp.]
MEQKEKNAKSGKKKTSRKSGRKKDNFVTRHSLALLIAAIAVVILIGAAAIFCTGNYRGEDKWVYIPRGSDSKDIKDSLQSALGLSDGKRVYFLWNLMGGRSETACGAYLIPKGTKSLSAARRLKRGTQTPVKIRFNNAVSFGDIAKKITTKTECDSASFIHAAQKILTDSGYAPQEFTAAFLPDTYETYWNDSPEKIVDRLLKANRRFWDENRKKKAAELGLTPVQVSTLAAIVEEETAKADERPIVARLYLNRLKSGMKLQADPTVKFAVGDRSLRRITGSHLKIESPYNTYLHAGLPPGPIRVPEATTLDAVLDAPPHNYLYMCAKEDFSGYHNFAVDYATHMNNARRYQAELNKRGIH